MSNESQFKIWVVLLMVTLMWALLILGNLGICIFIVGFIVGAKLIYHAVLWKQERGWKP